MLGVALAVVMEVAPPTTFVPGSPHLVVDVDMDATVSSSIPTGMKKKLAKKQVLGRCSNHELGQQRPSGVGCQCQLRTDSWQRY